METVPSSALKYVKRSMMAVPAISAAIRWCIKHIPKHERLGNNINEQWDDKTIVIH